LDPPRITQNGGTPAASAGDGVATGVSRNIIASAKAIVKDAMGRSGLVIIVPIAAAPKILNFFMIVLDVVGGIQALRFRKHFRAKKRKGAAERFAASSLRIRLGRKPLAGDILKYRRSS
jgi:hypothetical protein